MTVLETTHRQPGIGSVIMRGTSWTLLAQTAPLVVNVIMTPYVVHGFGVNRYGLFLLSNVIVLFLGSFDGGISSSVMRYAAVYAGNDDRASATRLVVSLLALTTILGAVLFAALFVAAPSLMTVFHVPAGLRAEGIFLLRTMAVITGISQVRGLFAGQLAGRQISRLTAMSTLASYGVYAVGLIITVRGHHGLRGVAYTFMAQAVVATALLVPRSLTLLDRRAIAFMPRAEAREFLRYAARVQVTGLTNIVTNQADTFIVGRLLSIRDVAIYGAGLNFATQLRNVPVNALGPISTTLSQAYGRGGDDEAVEVFARLQRRWVQATTGWVATGLAAAYFGVPVWLGPEFDRSGLVSCILLAAFGVNLWTGTLTALLIAVGRPGLETRYVLFAVVVNVVLTIPFVFYFGLIGTVVATAIGTALGSVYLLRVATRHYRDDLPSFLREVPVAAAAAAVATVTALEWLCRPVLPHGALGLVGSGLVAAPGLLAYAMVLLGPAGTWRLVAARLRPDRRDAAEGVPAS